MAAGSAYVKGANSAAATLVATTGADPSSMLVVTSPAAATSSPSRTRLQVGTQRSGSPGKVVTVGGSGAAVVRPTPSAPAGVWQVGTVPHGTRPWSVGPAAATHSWPRAVPTVSYCQPLHSRLLLPLRSCGRGCRQ